MEDPAFPTRASRSTTTEPPKWLAFQPDRLGTQSTWDPIEGASCPTTLRSRGMDPWFGGSSVCVRMVFPQAEVHG